MTTDINARRAYPFVPGTVGQGGLPMTGISALPNTVFTSFRGFVAVPKGSAAGNDLFRAEGTKIRLSSVSRSSDGTTFTAVFELTGYGPALTVSFTVPFVGRTVAQSAPSDGSHFIRTTIAPEGTGLAAGDTVLGFEFLSPPEGIVEPTCVIGITRVLTLSIQNHTGARRPGLTGYTPPVGWYAAPPTSVFGGIVPLVAGTNAIVTVFTNAVRFGGAPGAGTGGVCAVPTRVVGETPPDGADTIDGGTPCAGLVRTVNGVPGPDVYITGVGGVTVVPGDDPATLVVSVGQDGAAGC